MSEKLKGKSYNQVMNEWKAQQSFLKRAGTGMLRPGHHVTGVSRLWGWTWRVLMILGIPLIFYMGIIRMHAKTAEFTDQLAAETKRFLGAESVTFNSSRWDWNGELRTAHVKIKGSPANIFSYADLANVNTWITAPGVFRSAWHLNKVSIASGTVNLRAGALPKAAAADRSPALLTAGWGINPDFSQLTIDAYECDKLTLKWDNSPSTAGELAGSAVSFTRTGTGWDLTATGGTFRQGWLDGMRVTAAAIRIGTDSAVIEKGDFTLPGGGSGSLTGSFTLGEVPEINATIKVENVPFHPFLPEYFHRFVKAVCQGTVTLTGSTNRSTGILMDSKLTLKSGTLSGIPIFRALELATGETHLSQPDLTGGHLHFTSQGTQEPGSLIVEATDVLLESGSRMRIGLTMRHERKQVLASRVQSIRDTESSNTAESITLNTAGTLRIGLPPETAAKLKLSIRKAFITREADGFQWMEIPCRFDEVEFTRDSADRIIALQNAGE